MTEPLPEALRRREAYEWFKQRIAAISGVPLIDGEVDEDNMTVEMLHDAVAVVQAEMVVAVAPDSAAMKELDEQKLEDEIVQILDSLPEDHPVWRLINGTMPDEERDAFARETYGSMSEEELFDTLRSLVPEDRIRVRRLLGMDEDE
jgi:hypothetical protein